MTKKNQLPLTVRLPKPQLEYIRKSAKLNCRIISGQTEFMLGVAIILQSEYPDVFNEISLKINDQLKDIRKE